MVLGKRGRGGKKPGRSYWKITQPEALGNPGLEKLVFTLSH